MTLSFEEEKKKTLLVKSHWIFGKWAVPAPYWNFKLKTHIFLVIKVIRLKPKSTWKQLSLPYWKRVGFVVVSDKWKISVVRLGVTFFIKFMHSLALKVNKQVNTLRLLGSLCSLGCKSVTSMILVIIHGLVCIVPVKFLVLTATKTILFH